MGLPHCSQSHLGVSPRVKGWPGSSHVLVETDPNSQRRGLLSVLLVVSVRMGTGGDNGGRGQCCPPEALGSVGSGALALLLAPVGSSGYILRSDLCDGRLIGLNR